MISLRDFSSYLQNKSTSSWSEWALGVLTLGEELPTLPGCWWEWGEHASLPHPAPVSHRITLGPASAVACFCRDPAFLEQQLPGKVLQQVWDSLQERPQDWRDCVRWARRRWQSCYHDTITQLLHTYPPEHVSQCHRAGTPACPSLHSPGTHIPGPDSSLPVPGNQPGCPLLGRGQELSPSTDIRP